MIPFPASNSKNKKDDSMFIILCGIGKTGNKIYIIRIDCKNAVTAQWFFLHRDIGGGGKGG